MNYSRSLFALGCALLQSIAAAQEALPGRLFFTAAERRTLEYARQHSAPQRPPDAAQAPAAFRFDGMVWRQDRLIALWIDRQPTAADRFRRPDFTRAQLQFTDPAGRLVRLDAGDAWTPALLPLAPTTHPTQITPGPVVPTR